MLSDTIGEGAVPLLHERRVLVLSDGRAGHVNQSLGIAAALGVHDPEVITMYFKRPEKWLRWLPVQYLMGHIPAPDAADVLIGTGWQVSRVLRYLKRTNKTLFTIQCMRPSGKPADYDAVVVPAHDAKGLWGSHAPQVVMTVGAPNRVTVEKVRDEAQRWSQRLQGCTSPAIAVLVGGSSGHGVFTANDARNLIESALLTAKNEGGSLLVSTSRRTGAEATRAVVSVLRSQKTVPYHFWQPDDPNARDNPYMAYLGKADAVIVTPESVAMVSEAATVGKCVYIWGPLSQVHGKLKAFYEVMVKQGRVVQWKGSLNMRKPAQGLMDTQMAAGFIRSRWMKRWQ